MPYHKSGAKVGIFLSALHIYFGSCKMQDRIECEYVQRSYYHHTQITQTRQGLGTLSAKVTFCTKHHQYKYCYHWGYLFSFTTLFPFFWKEYMLGKRKIGKKVKTNKTFYFQGKPRKKYGLTLAVLIIEFFIKYGCFVLFISVFRYLF